MSSRAWPYFLIALASGLCIVSAASAPLLAIILPAPFLIAAWFVARHVGPALSIPYLVTYGVWLCLSVQPQALPATIAAWLLVPLSWCLFARAAKVKSPIWLAFPASALLFVLAIDLYIPALLAGTLLFLAIGYRRRIVACRLLLVGMLITTLPTAAHLFVSGGEVAGTITALALLVWPFFVVYALHRRELGKLERPAAQALTGAAFVAIYLDLMIVALLLVGRRLHWPPDFLLAAITITAVAILLALPGLDIFGRAMQRLIYGRVFDPSQAVAMLAAATPATMDLDAVGPLVDRTLRRYLGISRMALYLEGERLPALLYASDGAPAVLEKVPAWVELQLPLTLRGHNVGRLLLGGKAHDSFYAPHEVAQLWTLSEHVAAAVEVARLVQEMERLHGQVAEQERMAALGRMVASVGHEFATPLQIAKIALQMMPNVALDDIEDYRMAALKQVNLLARLVAGLRNSLQPAPAELVTDANAIVIETVEQMRASLNGITINLALHPEPLPAWMTKMELRQVLRNLIQNAGEACRGRIDIETAEGPAIRIIDNGPGIPDTLRQSIFDPFTTTKPYGGAGLGLYTVYSAVQRRGGRVEVDSPREGEGTAITIYLLAEPTDHMRAVAGKAQPGAYFGRNRI